jgi:transposase InsO family protein
MSSGGIRAIYPGPNTSQGDKRHAIHPYLLRDMPIERINQVWMVDITYLRAPGGFVCVFRPNLTTDSGHIRPLNPIVSDHRFRSI